MTSAALTRYKASISLPGIKYGSEPLLDPDDPKVKKWVRNKFLVPIEVVRKPAVGGLVDSVTLISELDEPEHFIPQVSDRTPEILKTVSNESGGSWLASVEDDAPDKPVQEL